MNMHANIYVMISYICMLSFLVYWNYVRVQLCTILLRQQERSYVKEKKFRS